MQQRFTVPGLILLSSVVALSACSGESELGYTVEPSVDGLEDTPEVSPVDSPASNIFDPMQINSQIRLLASNMKICRMSVGWITAGIRSSLR